MLRRRPSSIHDSLPPRPRCTLDQEVPMGSGSWRALVLSFGLVAGGLVSEAAADEPPPPPFDWSWGVQGLVGSPRGELANHVGTGGGIAGHALFARQGSP